MKREEVLKELDFLREQLEVFRNRTEILENGNLNKSISNHDYDKYTFHRGYDNIIREINGLIKYQYDAEN